MSCDQPDRAAVDAARVRDGRPPLTETGDPALDRCGRPVPDGTPCELCGSVYACTCRPYHAAVDSEYPPMTDARERLRIAEARIAAMTPVVEAARVVAASAMDIGKLRAALSTYDKATKQ